MTLSEISEVCPCVKDSEIEAVAPIVEPMLATLAVPRVDVRLD
jgi:hypothetical protein